MEYRTEQVVTQGGALAYRSIPINTRQYAVVHSPFTYETDMTEPVTDYLVARELAEKLQADGHEHVVLVEIIKDYNES